MLVRSPIAWISCTCVGRSLVLTPALAHGDSNLIDIYQPNSDHNNKWRRVLVDTGHAKEGGKIKAAILEAIDRVAIPKPTNENPVPDPFVPPLAELQVCSCTIS